MKVEKPEKRIKPVIEEVPEPLEMMAAEEVVEGRGENEDIGKIEQAKEESPQSKVNIKLVVIITVVSALVAAIVSGGVYVYLSGAESLEKPLEATPAPVVLETPAVTASPSPSPEPVDVSKVTVRVLNGSGKIGAAGAGEDVLVRAGFKVGSTGNADNYNFKKTVIQIKTGVPAQVVELAKKALEESDYTVEVGGVLPASSDYDMIVTVGLN